MKKRIIGIFTIILGLLIAIGPNTIFHVCISDGDMLMSCNYTAIAESITGAFIALLGLIYTSVSQVKVRLSLSILTAIASIFVFLFPTFIIGVCGGKHMHCHAVALPALVILSIILFILT
jgi:hypothetical protein